MVDLVGLWLTIYICFCEPEVFNNVENMKNKNKETLRRLWRDVTADEYTPRHKMAPPAVINSEPQTNEEVKELGEGWLDIYVQGRPHWDGTGNANYCRCDVSLTHFSILHNLYRWVN